MIYKNLLVHFVFWPSVHSLSVQPRPSTTLQTWDNCQRQIVRSISGCAIVIAASTHVLPVSIANAVEVIKVEADIPALIQLAKDNKDIALKLAQQTAGVVKVTDYPKSYKNILNFVRDVAAGDVYVQVNGIPIDVSVVSEKGAIDIDLFTEVGDIGVTVASDYLPKLPFLSKRAESNKNTAAAASVATTEASKVDEATSLTSSGRTRAAAAIQEAEAKKPLLDRPFFIDPFQQGWTIKQVLGTTSLSLGLAYASSYAYYIKSQEDEEKAAAEKKQAAAAAAKLKKESVVKKPPKEAVVVESTNDVAQSDEPAKVTTTIVKEEPVDDKKAATKDSGGFFPWRRNK